MIPVSKRLFPVLLEPGVGTKVTAAAAILKKILHIFKFKWIKSQVINQIFLF